MSDKEALEQLFPGLRNSACRLTSPPDPDYNCIAWAAGDAENVWWPDSHRQCFWPRLVPRFRTTEAFVAAFATLGYAVVDSEDLESGIEKVALFALDSLPTHAARQLPNGEWTSKCGRDIAHELRALEGAEYGQVVIILGRHRAAAEQP